MQGGGGCRMATVRVRLREDAVGGRRFYHFGKINAFLLVTASHILPTSAMKSDHILSKHNLAASSVKYSFMFTHLWTSFVLDSHVSKSCVSSTQLQIVTTAARIMGDDSRHT